MGRTAGIIKICGVTTGDAIDACCAANVNWIGLVFAPASPRYLTLEAAQNLASRIPIGTQVVGLFADQPAEDIRRIAARVPLDKIQLHGRETADQILKIRDNVERPVIVARGIETPEDVLAASEMPGDYLLLDARPPKGSAQTGGHGTQFDWSLLDQLETSAHWLLAGGLDPDNVADAITAVGGYGGFAGVDVSSGVEREKGIKDADKIRAFAKAARRGFRL